MEYITAELLTVINPGIIVRHQVNQMKQNRHVMLLRRPTYTERAAPELKSAVVLGVRVDQSQSCDVGTAVLEVLQVHRVEVLKTTKLVCDYKFTETARNR